MSSRSSQEKTTLYAQEIILDYSKYESLEKLVLETEKDFTLEAINLTCQMLYICTY